MNRRLIALIAGAVVLIGLAIAGFLLLRGDGGLTVGPNPFGSAGDRDPNDLGPVTAVGEPVEGAGLVIIPQLIKITDGPVAKGFIALYRAPTGTYASAGTSTATSTDAVTGTPEDVEVRYIERQSGNVYSFHVHDRVATRLSNKTLPGIQEAHWLGDGSRAFVRFLEKDSAGIEHVSTYLLPGDGEGGYFLEQDLSEVRTASSSVLSLLSGTSGSIASLSGSDGTSGRTLFSTVFSSLHVAFAGASFVATTKASVHLDGYAFLVDSRGSFTRLLGPLRGLSTLPSPNGAHVLYSYVDRNKLYTQVLDVANRTTVPLPLVTLAEKCVWSSGSDVLYCAIPVAITGALPDIWYQGAHSFTDRIWKIDLASRVATLVLDPRQTADENMDIEGMAIDRTSDVLVFMNRNDGSLWSFDL